MYSLFFHREITGNNVFLLSQIVKSLKTASAVITQIILFIAFIVEFNFKIFNAAFLAYHRWKTGME